MSEQNKAVVRRLVECWNQKPGPAAMANELYDANCTINVPGITLRGRAGAQQFLTTYLNAFPDVRVTAEDLLAEGDKVTLRWRCKATHKGELQGVAASGKPVDVAGTAIYRLVGGKIVEEHNVWDTLSMMQQIGAVGQVGRAGAAGR